MHPPNSKSAKDADKTTASHEEWRMSLPSHGTSFSPKRKHTTLAKNTIGIDHLGSAPYWACRFIQLYEQALRRQGRTDWIIARGPDLAPVPEHHQRLGDKGAGASVDIQLRNWNGILHTMLWVCPSGKQVDWYYIRWHESAPTGCVFDLGTSLLAGVLTYIVSTPLGSQMAAIFGVVASLLFGLSIAGMVGNAAEDKLHRATQLHDSARLANIQEASSLLEEELTGGPEPEIAAGQQDTPQGGSPVKKRW